MDTSSRLAALRRLFLSVACTAALAGCAQPPPQRKPQLLWAGIYEAARSKVVEEPGVVGGARLQSEGITFLKQTSEIPAALGTRFGIFYSVPGASEEHLVQYDIRWQFPKPGLKDPQFNGDIVVWDRNPRLTGLSENYTGYQLTKEWEVVRGRWTVQILMDDKVVLEQHFQVD